MYHKGYNYFEIGQLFNFNAYFKDLNGYFKKLTLNLF